MAVYLTEVVTDLAMPPQQRPIPHQFAMGDNNAYTITALLCDSRNPEAELLDGTVGGELVRPDGVTVALAGEKGNAVRQVNLAAGGLCNATPCSVTLPQACFAVPGRVTLTIKLTDGTTITQALSVSAVVVRTSTDEAVDPGEVIPDLAAIQAAAAEATAAAADARSAASSAVRYDTAQTLTTAQQAQARENIGAAGLDVGQMEVTARQYEFHLVPGAISSSGADVNGTGGDAAYYTKSSCRTAEYIEIGNDVQGITVSYDRPEDADTSGTAHYYIYVCFYNASKTFISRMGDADIQSYTVSEIPANAAFFRVSFTFVKQQDTKACNIAGYVQTAVKSVVSALNVQTVRRGIVLGDSISFGFWSYWDGSSRKNADDLYSNIAQTAAPMRISDWLSLYCGIPMDNIARRGTGWVADSRSLGNAWTVAQATDFSGYDFVGLCFGVNDYIQKTPLGTLSDAQVGTVIGNMIRVLEKIYTDNPLAKVIVYSPLNTWGQYRDSAGSSQTLYGDASTHYALGYDFGGTSYTLQQLIDAMEAVCDRYDIRHVVMSQGCTINVFNIKDILIDGLHPSQSAMKSIASDMYHTMMFR